MIHTRFRELIRLGVARGADPIHAHLARGGTLG